MLNLPYNLLAASDEGPMRFIAILIFVAIIVIGNLLQWLQKRQEQKRLQEQQRRARVQSAPPPQQRPTAGRPSPRPTPQLRRPAQLQRAIPGQRPVPAQRKPQLRPTPPLPPLPTRRPAAAQPEVAELESRVTQHRHAAGQDITASEIGSGTRSAASAATTRDNMLRALLNPRSLRQAYILTEIFQPPIALRDPGPL